MAEPPRTLWRGGWSSKTLVKGRFATVVETAEYMGQGDLHARKFDNMVRSVNLLAKMVSRASLGIGASIKYLCL
jgi:hypothetical protein